MKELFLTDATVVGDLAEMMNVKAVAVIERVFGDLGLLATIYDQLTFDQARTVAAAFGYAARQKGS